VPWELLWQGREQGGKGRGVGGEGGWDVGEEGGWGLGKKGGWDAN